MSNSKYEKYKTEKEKLDAVKKDYTEIRYIHNPSEEVQLMAVNDIFDMAIHFIKNPIDKVKKVSVEKNPKTIKYIKNPSTEIKLIAIKRDISLIEYINNPSKETIEYVVRNCRNLMVLRTMRIDFEELDKDLKDILLKNFREI